MHYKAMITGVMVMLVVGCSQTTDVVQQTQANQLAISSVKDAPFYYPSGARFAIEPRFVTSELVSQAQQQALYQATSLYLEQALRERGFILVSAEQSPDFVVKFAVALAKDLSDESISEHFGLTPGLSNNEALNKASLLIAIDDASSGQRFWRGAAQGFAKEDASKAYRAERLKAVINKVLMQFET
ncbi:DUF4136 domain-containing protein [Thalassotalea sp. LPB0316]|uniref:DUF4136 domain-containing protein n=1 Tax=Thalassotalea sp. LPB0316 TaxID=2769490 RepID=UPI00186909E1|nr:DUF4136 domain-containing protein [Thalassotalea sp. LPB0316]QOL26688.1 DUF4136 domain-containing protein [Thalassotalea sp. LPB0316]